ncbi:unnamed protein product, partial [Meganyctiphanes norvegica]
MRALHGGGLLRGLLLVTALVLFINNPHTVQANKNRNKQIKSTEWDADQPEVEEFDESILVSPTATADSVVSPAGSLSPSQVPQEPRAKDTKQGDLRTEGPLDNEVNETQTPKRRNKGSRGKKNKGDQQQKVEGEEVTTIGGEEVSTVVVKEEELVEEEPAQRIVYSLAVVNKSYKAVDDFNPRGMEHLYLITNLFLQLVHRDQEMPKELSSMVSAELVSPTLDSAQAQRVVGELEANWDVLLTHYIGLVALAVLGVLTVVVMPVAGLVFACCRCAGRCGGEEPPYDKKRDPCKRVALGTFLTLITVILMFGLVCAFVTNARVEVGVQHLPEDVKIAVHDIQLYLNNTDKEVQNVLVNNYQELQKVLFTKLDSSGELVKMELGRVTKAIAIDNLTDIATSLSKIKTDLSMIKNTTLHLQDQTSNLQSGLSDVARRLISLQESCKLLPECQDLIDQYADKLRISNDFDRYLESDVLPQLPNVESKLDDVSRLIENDIEIVVKRGKVSFDWIATEIQKKVQSSIPNIKDKIREGGVKLKEAAETIHTNLQKVKLEETHKYVRHMQDGINEYSMYRYWAFMGLCILLLCITSCFILGVLFGCCGRRPDEATSCYKSTGASWLMCGVFLTFLFSSLIMAVTTALFVVGSATEILVCDPFKDPTDSEVFELIGENLRIEQFYPAGEAPHLTEIIAKCHQNQSLYSVVSWQIIDNSLGDLKNYRDQLKLEEKIDRLMDQIKVDTKVEILSRDAKQQLWELANSSVADKDTWDYYTDILEKKVMSINLMELAALLNQTADHLTDGFDGVSFKLKNDALYLEGLQRWVTSIGSLTRSLKATTERLNEHLKFNKTSLREAIADLISQAEFAQSYLRTNGSKEVTQLVQRFSSDFLADVDEYVAHLQVSVEQEIGRCGPLSTNYNATTHALCKDILYPFNGFWASVGWCFLFFIPAMILSVHLSTLYRKTEPYPGPLNESSHESMYDAYAEGDNLPLTSSGYDKKGGRRSQNYDGHVSSSYTPDVPYNGARASPPRTDYNNTNPDWADYPPSGGPPRYSSQPSLSPEYERPPPYYYPGPGENL